MPKKQLMKATMPTARLPSTISMPMLATARAVLPVCLLMS
jgi:hypothetical protein